MKKALKTAFLYIGTMVGAGFSSGREIALFFGGLTPLNVALSAVFMSAFALLFLTAGKLKIVPNGRLTRFLIFFSASISLVSMLAGGEYVMRSMTTIPLLALVMAILAVIVVSQGIEKIKVANAILVPLIVLSVAILYFKVGASNGSLPFSLSKPILYSGLDVLLGGVIVSSEGEDMKYGEIFGACAVICASLFAMLFMLQTVVLADKNDSLMPVFAISREFHLQAICGILIAAAIFTTLISSLKITSDYLANLALCTSKTSFLAKDENKSVVVMFCLVIAYPFSFFGFKNIVNTMYPINSVLGILLALATLMKLLTFFVKNARRKPSLQRPHSVPVHYAIKSEPTLSRQKKRPRHTAEPLKNPK